MTAPIRAKLWKFAPFFFFPLAACTPGAVSAGGEGGLGGATGSAPVGELGGSPASDPTVAVGGCGNASFDHDGHEETACVAWSKCEPGTVVFVQGTPTSDRECGLCPSGQFSKGENWYGCRDWQMCSAGEFLRAEGSAAADVLCESCPPGTFSEVANSPACLPCPDGTFSGMGATSCAPYQVCGWDEVETAPGTGQGDTVCELGSAFRQFGTSVSDAARDVAAAPDGGAYVVGETAGALAGLSVGSSDSFLRRYDVRGEVLWTRQFGSTEGESALGVVVDGLGHVIVLREGNVGSYLHKFDEDGEAIWEIEATSSNSSYAYHLAVDGSGNIFIAGNTADPSQEDYDGSWDVFVRKFAADGQLMWDRQTGSTAHENVGGIAVTTGGSIRVAGWTLGNLGDFNSGGGDVFVWGLHTGGQEQWLVQFGTDQDDVATAVVAGAASTYVAGWTEGLLTWPNLGEADLFVRELDQTGAEVATAQYGAEHGIAPHDLALDGERIHVLARAEFAADDGPWDAEGLLLTYEWPLSSAPWLSFGSDGYEGPTGIAVSETGHLFVSGYTSGALQGESFGGLDAFLARFEVPPG